jgi:hypothetical protein
VTGRLIDLVGIEVEHGVNQRGHGFVIIRAIGDGATSFGEVDPAEARKIATDLMNVAARAEYEQDLLVGGANVGLDMPMMAPLVDALRKAEAARHTG